MRLRNTQVGGALSAAVAVVFLAMFPATPCWAIAVGYTDHFNDNDRHGWRVGQNSMVWPDIVEDNGQNGAGDHSLYFATSGAGGDFARMVIMNDAFMDDGNWEGNWTAAGVRQISLDVQNTNAYPLKMRLGIAGPEGIFAGGGGDTFVTDAIEVPPNAGSWKRISFSVLAADWNLARCVRIFWTRPQY